MTRNTNCMLLGMLMLILAATTLVSGCADRVPTSPAVRSDEPVSTVVPPTPANPSVIPPLPGNKPAAPAKTMTIKIYWVESGQNALAVERAIPYTKGVARAAVENLLAGLLPSEKETWPALDSTIPVGSRLLSITVENRIARVNLSKEFESGGGTFSVTARIAQMVYTLCAIPNINAVEFSIEGKKVKIFSSEGLMLNGPQKPVEYYNLLPIDA